LQEQRPPFTPDSELSVVLSGISPSFDGLSQSPGQVIHVLLTRAPVYSPGCPDFLPRLACLRHAASVRSEPGSNSPCKLIVSSRADAATASDGMDRPQLNQRNRTGLDPHSIPAARLKACTTIQFSKTGALRGKRKYYRSAPPVSIHFLVGVEKFPIVPKLHADFARRFLPIPAAPIAQAVGPHNTSAAPPVGRISWTIANSRAVGGGAAGADAPAAAQRESTPRSCTGPDGPV
jgi:hypothetical protein